MAHDKHGEVIIFGFLGSGLKTPRVGFLALPASGGLFFVLINYNIY